MFRKEAAIECQELGRIHDQVTGQARRPRWQEDIPGSIGKFQVRGDGGYDCGLNPTEVEGICLNYEHWPSVSVGKVRPPDFPSLNLDQLYQVSFLRDFSCARLSEASIFAAWREYTSLRRSVIAFPSFGFRNSAIALAYSSLLETREMAR